mgnify:CR=1 FL=1
MSKQIKVWGMSYGLIGDLIAGLPMLTYYEKKYPGSYKYFAIEKRCAFMAPLFLNHSLIDRIKISDEWNGWGEKDRKIISECDIKAVYENWKHDSKDWYNHTHFFEETAILAGIRDIKDVLTEEEQRPKLDKWFDVGFRNAKNHTYSKKNARDMNEFDKNVAIWPFAQAESHLGRSPSTSWWNKLIQALTKEDYTVHHYGKDTDPDLSNSPNYKKLTSMSFFDQTKASLASKVIIGPNTGPMFVAGAYSHPAIHLLTNYYPDHNDNFLSLAP